MNAKNEADTFVTKVAFVGQPNVGKSTLLNALVGMKIAPTTRKPQTTRRIIRGIRTRNNCQQIYFDTPGIVRKVTGLDRFMHSQIFEALSDVDQIVAIVDANDLVASHLKFLKVICAQAKKNNQIVLLAVSKIDTINNKAKLLSLISEYHRELDLDNIVPLSAIKKDGLEVLFQVISQGAACAPFIFSEDFFTDASEKEIVSELIREKAMLELNEEIPYRLAITVEHFDESRREDEKKPLITIEANIHVERKSQKAIVIGKGGSSIRNIGMRARKEIENLLQCQVMLKLFVRVEEEWTTSAKGLRKLGY